MDVTGGITEVPAWAYLSEPGSPGFRNITRKQLNGEAVLDTAHGIGIEPASDIVNFTV
jgi:hypothetical protein